MDPNSPRPGIRSGFVADDAGGRAAPVETRIGVDEAPDPYADEVRWPAWKVSVFVILFSGICWSAIAFVASRLFG